MDKTIVGILGTVHTDDLRAELNYPLERLRDEILAFHPDVICGEVRPEDWEQNHEDPNYAGYLGPSEYRRLILPLCAEQGIEFVPVDWFEMDLARLDYGRLLTPEQDAQADEELGRHYERIFERAKRSAIPCNSLETDELVRAKMDFLQSLEPTVHNIITACRNQIMIERIRQATAARPGKRILCTVGFEHNAFYHRGLQGGDWSLVYPLKPY